MIKKKSSGEGAAAKPSSSHETHDASGHGQHGTTSKPAKAKGDGQSTGAPMGLILAAGIIILILWVYQSCSGDANKKDTATSTIQSQPAVVPEVHKGQVMWMKPFTFHGCIIQNLHRGWYSYVFLGDIEVRSEDGKVLAVLSSGKEVSLGWLPEDADYYFCPSPSDGSPRKIHIYNNWEASARSQSQP